MYKIKKLMVFYTKGHIVGKMLSFCIVTELVSFFNTSYVERCVNGERTVHKPP
jgi:hypothetical protein